MSETPQADLGTLFAVETRPDPYPVLKALREASPVVLMDGGMVVLAKHEDCNHVLRHPAASVDRSKSRIATVQGRERAMSFLDPPDHTRLRRLVTKAFTPRVVAKLEPRIREVVNQAFENIEGDSFEVASQLAYPLPLTIISEMLTVPAEDKQLFEDWSRRIARNVDPLVVDRDPQDGRDARDEFREYFRQIIAKGNIDPETLLGRLVAAEEEGDQLSEEELLTTLVLLVVAGHDTTAITITNAILALLRNPEQLKLLQDDPSLVDNAIEETLRYDPAVHLTTRVAAEPIEVGGMKVDTGTDMLFLLAGANRDPGAFKDPDRFDIRRGAVNHLAFSAGPHYCLGNSLAKLQASIALEAFITRVKDPELDEASLRYRPHVNMRGLEYMKVSMSGVAGPA